ncbi:MAG: STAS domain-containing protein [Eubacterium sp.]
MIINTNLNATELTISLVGRLDTSTSNQLETVLKNSLEGITSLIMDFAELNYISSSGLRILLSTQKIMNNQGKMVLHNVSEDIMEIFQMTKFDSFLTIV